MPLAPCDPALDLLFADAQKYESQRRHSRPQAITVMALECRAAQHRPLTPRYRVRQEHPEPLQPGAAIGIIQRPARAHLLDIDRIVIGIPLDMATPHLVRERLGNTTLAAGRHPHHHHRFDNHTMSSIRFLTKHSHGEFSVTIRQPSCQARMMHFVRTCRSPGALARRDSYARCLTPALTSIPHNAPPPGGRADNTRSLPILPEPWLVSGSARHQTGELHHGNLLSG